jgi:hypothetical protein
VVEGISSLNLHEKRTILNRISKPCKDKPNSHAWNIQRSSRSNRFPHFPGYGSGPPQAMQDRTHTNCAGHTSVARLHDRTPICYAERTPTHQCMCTTETKIIEWWRHFHMPSPGTRLTALPYFAACG